MQKKFLPRNLKYHFKSLEVERGTKWSDEHLELALEAVNKGELKPQQSFKGV